MENLYAKIWGYEFTDWYNQRKNQYLDPPASHARALRAVFHFSFHSPNPRKERIIVERDELGKIIHSKSPALLLL